MYKLSNNPDFIVHLDDGAIIPMDAGNSDYAAYLAWVDAGYTPAPPEGPDSATLLKLGEVAIQKVMDEMARTRGYDDIKSACAYASPTPVVAEDSPLFERCERFRIEGNALQQWMAQTWAKAYDYLDLVAAGQHPMPTPDEAVAMMPAFSWPG
jgi:hypothetical protein